jgi:multidrug efflux pump subunit AcrB
LVVAIAIPLTISLVFVAGYFFGETINRITLFALILSLGLLVDSATVVVENIYRHFRHENNKKKSIITAVNEVGMGLFISTLTSVIVFLPTSHISGMMGEYMGPLSIFVPMALIMSLLVAYILTPFLADLLLPIHVSQNNKPKKTEIFARLSDGYGKLLKNLLEKKKPRRFFLISVFVSLAVVMLFPIFRLVHFKMLPNADRDQFFVYIDTPKGTDTPATHKIVQKVANQLLSYPEVTSIQSFTGEPAIMDFNGLFRGTHLREAPFLANLRVNLTNHNDRHITSSQIILDLRKQIQQYVQSENFSDINLSTLMKRSKINFVEDPPGPPVRSTLLLKIKGPDRKILSTVAEDMKTAFSQEAEVVDIDTTLENPAPRTVYKIDHDKALQSGVSAYDISEALQVALSHYEVGQYHYPNQKEFEDFLF